MNSLRTVINYPTNKINITIKKQFAYIAYELLSKYQSRLGDYLKYTSKVTSTSNDINIVITPKSVSDIKQTKPYEYHVICK